MSIPKSKIIKTSELIKRIKDGTQQKKRFCFVLGSGASFSSRIPTGNALGYTWMEEMAQDPGFEQVKKNAEILYNEKRLINDYDTIYEAWEKANADRTRSLDSKYYFDIYRLRFYQSHNDGYDYLEKLMEKAKPSFGYQALAQMLTADKRCNLVITTNFDSLVEESLFLYTDSKPLVINHEAMADFAANPNVKRPIIAKIHRGVLFEPLNDPDETSRLAEEWENVLRILLNQYIPVIIGYGGGDKTLMKLLQDKTMKLYNGLYWCCYSQSDYDNEDITSVLNMNHDYYAVETSGFDAVMLALGLQFFKEKIDPYNVEMYLTEQAEQRANNYHRAYEDLPKELKPESGSDNEYNKNARKLVNQIFSAASKRQLLNQFTAWDYYRKGVKLYNDKKYSEAIEAFDEAIERNPEFAEAYGVRGDAYRLLREYDKAIADYDKAIQIKPDFPEAYIGRGLAFQALREYDKAIADYDKAIQIKPDFPEVYVVRGIVYRLLHEYDKAIADFDKAIQIKPDYPEAYDNRGFAFFELGDNDNAIKDITQAINLNSEYAPAYNSFGIIYYYMNDMERALSYSNKAVELESEEKASYITRGKVYAAMGEYEKAVDDCETALKLHPELAEAYMLYGIIYQKKGEYEKAFESYSKAVELKPVNIYNQLETYRGRAEVFRTLGDEEAAAKDEEAVRTLELLRSSYKK